MDITQLLKTLSIKTSSKIVLIVADGLGGLPNPNTGKSELEMAHLPNINKLAGKSICGLIDPVSPGITPGSGPAHLALFGYNPLEYVIGRGILSALGVNFPIKQGDVAARINFATVNDEGIIVDRRAGRLPTKQSSLLCEKLEQIKFNEVAIFVKPEKEHRAVVIFRGQNLDGALSDSDPQKEGLPAQPVKPIMSSEAQYTADIVNQFIHQAKVLLATSFPANMLLLRGFAQYKPIPTITELYKLTPASISTYPMYQGVTKLMGLTVLPTGDTLQAEIETLTENFDQYDFFFLHIKKTDTNGEDGNFEGKVAALEEIDRYFPEIINLKPDVLIFTGDHSTPALMKAHSWHPVPILLFSQYCRSDGVDRFDEYTCLRGGLGRISATNLMALALAHALKLEKFGA